MSRFKKKKNPASCQQAKEGVGIQHSLQLGSFCLVRPCDPDSVGMCIQVGDKLKSPQMSVSTFVTGGRGHEGLIHWK